MDQLLDPPVALPDRNIAKQHFPAFFHTLLRLLQRLFSDRFKRPLGNHLARKQPRKLIVNVIRV